MFVPSRNRNRRNVSRKAYLVGARAKFDVDQWIDQSYLKAALKDLKLETYWPIFQVNGKILGT